MLRFMGEVAACGNRSRRRAVPCWRITGRWIPCVSGGRARGSCQPPYQPRSPLPVQAGSQPETAYTISRAAAGSAQRSAGRWLHDAPRNVAALHSLMYNMRGWYWTSMVKTRDGGTLLASAYIGLNLARRRFDRALMAGLWPCQQTKKRASVTETTPQYG